jgi:hypothetical protein
MRAAHLAVARLEPTIVQGVDGGFALDLTFFDGGTVAVLPFVQVQPSYLVQRERTPLIWPQQTRSLGCDVLRNLERELLPWLESRLVARQENEEGIHIFGKRKPDFFDAARRAEFLGAARYAKIMPSLAPYVYAARFCTGRTVGIEDAQGANGAAFLATRASSVRAELNDSEERALASQWFGRQVFASTDTEYDVVIAPQTSRLRGRCAQILLDSQRAELRSVDVTRAVPVDVLISYDANDAPVARTFAVQAQMECQPRDIDPIAPREPTGGSSGRIVLLLREGFERVHDADVDEAQALAEHLRAEGFAVDLRSPATLEDGSPIDLLHAFGARAPALQPIFQRLRAAGVPIVVSNALPASLDEAVWGPEILKAAYQRASDDGMLAEFLDLVALRKLLSTSPPGAVSTDALGQVDVAIVSSATEEGHLRNCGFAGEAVRYAPSRNRAPAPESIAAMIGFDPFVFVHAPVEWRANLALVARAAAARRVRLVVAGPAVDVTALRVLQHAAADLVVYLPAPTEAELEALYRTARVYADVSWEARGCARGARAAACGGKLRVCCSWGAAARWPQAAQAAAASIGWL